MSTSVLVPESEYTSEYFLKHCGGFDRFSFDGYSISNAHKRCFNLADIQKNDVLLDLGCGRGELMYEANKHGAKVFGTDYAKASIDIVHTYIEKNRIDGITVEQATLPNIPFTGVRFTKVLFLDVIEHIYEPVVLATLDNIAKVCAKNGILVVHTDNKFFQVITVPLVNFFAKYLLGKKIPVDEHAKLHVNYQSLNGLIKKLEKRGFDMVSADYIYPTGPEDLKHWAQFRQPFILATVYFILKVCLRTPLRHLMCPTFDIKCKKR